MNNEYLHTTRKKSRTVNVPIGKNKMKKNKIPE